MRGRKPQDGAVRRGISDAYALTEPEEMRGVAMPDDIREDPVQSAIWAWVAPPVNNFTEQDIPTLRLLVFWHAVAAQAQQVMRLDDGAVDIFDKIGVKPFETPDGREIPLVRKNPALQVMKEASAEIRALSDMLGLSPLARSRIGLMDTAAVKTAADTAAMFRSIDDAYGLPEVEVAAEVEVVDAQD